MYSYFSSAHSDRRYSTHCSFVTACDFGDAQARPRFIIFASRHFVPLPLPPRPTHGPIVNPFPSSFLSKHGLVKSTARWVTTGDVLDVFNKVPDNHFPNMSDRKTSSLEPGDKDYNEIKADKLSPAIRASGPPLFHYALDRHGNRQCTSVRENAAIQGYPNWYEFFGNQGDKYKQVGNSVPVGLATAMARSAAEVLRFVYQGEEINLQGNRKNSTFEG